GATACAMVAHDIHTHDRRSPARMAAAPAHEPAHACPRGKHLHPAPELPRDRTLVAVAREMVLHLAERLDVPLRERNVLLVAAGFAPVFRERQLADPALASARQAIDLVLKGHEPYPALAVDLHWTMVAHNAAVARLIAGADASLLQPPVNVLRLSLHPKGLAPRIANLT